MGSLSVLTNAGCPPELRTQSPLIPGERFGGHGQLVALGTLVPVDASVGTLALSSRPR